MTSLRTLRVVISGSTSIVSLSSLVNLQTLHLHKSTTTQIPSPSPLPSCAFDVPNTLGALTDLTLRGFYMFHVPVLKQLISLSLVETRSLVDSIDNVLRCTSLTFLHLDRCCVFPDILLSKHLPLLATLEHSRFSLNHYSPHNSRNQQLVELTESKRLFPSLTRLSCGAMSAYTLQRCAQAIPSLRHLTVSDLVPSPELLNLAHLESFQLKTGTFLVKDILRSASTSSLTTLRINNGYDVDLRNLSRFTALTSLDLIERAQPYYPYSNNNAKKRQQQQQQQHGQKNSGLDALPHLPFLQTVAFPSTIPLSRIVTMYPNLTSIYILQPQHISDLRPLLQTLSRLRVVEVFNSLSHLPLASLETFASLPLLERLTSTNDYEEYSRARLLNIIHQRQTLPLPLET